MKLSIVVVLMFVTSFAFAATVGGNRYISTSAVFSNYNISSTDTKATNPTGGGYTLAAGYKFLFAAAEGFYKETSVDTDYDVSGGKQKLTMTDRMWGAGARFFLLFFNFKGGVVKHNFTENASVNDSSTTSPARHGDYGIYGGLGFRVPLYVLDAFSEYTYTTAGKTSMHEVEFGLRVYF